MSLLSRGREPFTAYPSTDAEDEFGGKRRVPGNPDGLGVEGRGNFVQPDSDTETPTGGGYDTTERLKLITRNFPFGAKTVVRRQGRLWDVVDEPLVRQMSGATEHVEAILVARTGVAR